MQIIEQSIDRQNADNAAGTSAATAHIISAEEKKLRVQHNVILAEYFKQKAKEPHALLEKLIEQHEKQVNGDTVVSPAPAFAPKGDKAEQPQGIGLLVSALHANSNQAATTTTSSAQGFSSSA